MATAASLRSVDLSRQVGAAIFTQDGDLVTVGCNEVPKAGGGNYWQDDSFKARDIDRQAESNRVETQRIIFGFIERLQEAGVVPTSTDVQKLLSDRNVIDAIDESLLSDITEYGRMTHAEMTAICDAARLGRSVRGSVMYVTTFPCHNCAKHIVASGVDRVIYIEPYPKSRAEHSHEDSLTMEPTRTDLVSFEHFQGVSPLRYRDLFEKGKRRGKDRTINDWYEGNPVPRIEQRGTEHVEREPRAIRVVLGKERGLTIQA